MTTEYVIDTDSVAEANCATGTEHPAKEDARFHYII